MKISAILSILLLLLTVTVVVLLNRYFVSPADVLTTKERVVAQTRLPNSESIRIIQYWNGGDFYNLELRHAAADGTTFECVIDADCFRIPECELEVNDSECVVLIKANNKKLARYQWNSKELVRGNGLLIRAEAVR